jgi:nitroreductase
MTTRDQYALDPAAMSVDEALTTTRAVRKRLDLTRPVPRDVLLECLHLAFQAPNGSNRQLWQWVIVDHADTRAQMAATYNGALDDYARHSTAPPVDHSVPANQRMFESVDHLKVHLHEVPVLVVPTIRGRLDVVPIAQQAHLWGSILPAVWSFMLALRARGLGSVWTTAHLQHEEKMAALLGIPYAEYTQAGLFPVAYTIGTDFKPGPRADLDDAIHWNRW